MILWRSGSGLEEWPLSRYSENAMVDLGWGLKESTGLWDGLLGPFDGLGVVTK